MAGGCITYRFNLKLLPSANTKLPVCPPCPPFNTGSWTIREGQNGYVYLKWRDVVDTIRIKSGSLLWIRRAGHHGTTPLTPGVFPPSLTGSLTVPYTSIDYSSTRGTFTVTLELEEAVEDSPPSTSSAGRVFAARSAVQIASAMPNNVRFYFPASKQELWSSVATLSAASPYFKSLFESGSVEGSVKDSTAVVEVQDDALDGIDEEDSDGETDRRLDKRMSPSPNESRDTSQDRTVAGFHDVVINSTSYTTYRSVLVWIYSGHIAFARLASKFDNDHSQRATVIERVSSQHPDLPLPASPKSVYRLAHFLDLDNLKKLALASIKSQITVGNVAQELFSDIGRTYSEVQAMEMNFAVTNWGEVKGTQGMKRVRSEMAAGNLDHSSGIILADLAMRLSS